jgi:hypothetical protein
MGAAPELMGAAPELMGAAPELMGTVPELMGTVKARDAINRRLYKGLIIVNTAIYRVFEASKILVETRN